MPFVFRVAFFYFQVYYNLKKQVLQHILQKTCLEMILVIYLWTRKCFKTHLKKQNVESILFVAGLL
jgi:hypothetical protein